MPGDRCEVPHVAAVAEHIEHGDPGTARGGPGSLPDNRALTCCDPMKPVPPVTNIRMRRMVGKRA
ncbi:hypothetical protein GCM10023079_28630 [Streptomyces chitinivorans]